MSTLSRACEARLNEPNSFVEKAVLFLIFLSPRRSANSCALTLSDLVGTGDQGSSAGQGHVHVSRVQDQRAEGCTFDHRSLDQFRYRDLAADVASAGTLDPARHRHAVRAIGIMGSIRIDISIQGHF